jgi:hypothetical protein
MTPCEVTVLSVTLNAAGDRAIGKQSSFKRPTIPYLTFAAISLSWTVLVLGSVGYFWLFHSSLSSNSQ